MEQIEVRDEKGRFVKGKWQGGPGRPKKTTEDGILDFFLQCLDQPGVKETALTTFKEKLQAGDLKTWQLMLSYLVGLPVQRVKLQSESTVLAGILGDLRNATSSETMADSNRESEDSQTP